MAWQEELDPGQRSPEWLESLTAGTFVTSHWQWSDADVVFSAYDDGPLPGSRAASSEKDEATSASSRSSSLSSHTAQTSPASTPGGLSPRSDRDAGAAAAAKAERTQALLVRSLRQGWNRAFELHHTWLRPCVRKPTEVLIRNRCIGLNPVDFKSVLYRFGIDAFPWVLGRDVAGVVEDVGPDVQGLAIGDRVWTCADSRDVRCGAYQEYSIAEAATVGKIPDAVSDEDAATLGTGLVTAAIALYWFFKLPLPSEVEQNSSSHHDWILIYGGGAITGIFAAQLARVSGLRVLAVASPSNFAYLRDSCGVTACVDRFTPPEELEAEILRAVGPHGRVRYALDCVGSKTAGICARVLEASGAGHSEQAHFIGLAGNPKEALPAEANVAIHRISFSTTFYGSASWSSRVLSEVDALLASGKLRPARVQLIPDGLAGVRGGLEMLRDGTAPGAVKLVAKIDETPAADLTNLGVRCELGWNGV